MNTDETRAKYDRLRTLSRFIRNQACLTDERTPRPGPGEVKLNHDAALLCADALDELIGLRFDEWLRQSGERRPA